MKKFIKQFFCCHVWSKLWHPKLKPSPWIFGYEYHRCIKCGKQKLFRIGEIPFDCRYKEDNHGR